jgi:hypothetical protein
LEREREGSNVGRTKGKDIRFLNTKRQISLRQDTHAHTVDLSKNKGKERINRWSVCEKEGVLPEAMSFFVYRFLFLYVNAPMSRRSEREAEKNQRKRLPHFFVIKIGASLT